MKPLLKLLLSLFILIAGIYAATPLWLPYVFARQLPPGWQLEKLETGYPGLSGISISVLHVKGELQTVGLELTATDVRYTYQGLKTDIGSLSLDVFMQASKNSDSNALKIDDLSLPITKLTGKTPELSVKQMQVALHSKANTEVGDINTTQPLVLDFQAFKLLPGANNDFNLSSNVGIEGIPAVNGRLDVDVRAGSRKAKLRFPAAVNSPAWLTVSLEQTDHDLNTTTQIQAVLDTEPADQEWLDVIVKQGTGALLTHVGGKLEIQANFAGKDIQGIKRLSLATENLRAELDDGTLTLNAELLADFEGEQITVLLPKPAEIHFQDRTGKINELIANAEPGLQRTSRPPTMALAEINTTSKFVIHAGVDPSMEFIGNIKLGMTSAESSANLQATDLRIGVEDFFRLDSITTNGRVTLNWEESTPFTYTSDDLELKANGLSITAELSSYNGELISTGHGTFFDGRIAQQNISADKIDMTWQELDLLNLTGKLSTRTQGFATVFDGETWTGFDFDITYALLGNDDINGSGIMKFDSGPELPIEFAGNTQAEHWDVTLLPATIKLTQLGGLLRVAHFELPESVKLTDGYIDMWGNVVVDDEITAKVTMKGNELGASMLESSASNASFAFNTSYGSTISASGQVSIETVALAGGVDVAHIRADLNLEDMDTFGLKNLHAEVFDGQVTLNSLRFSENRLEDTTVTLHHINLGHIMAFADIDGLEGTGFLDISLPVGSDQAGVYVKNGTFKSAGSGRLAYTKEGVAGSNIGLQALENFQYTDLSGTINYQSDGTYQITIRLEGQNPDLYGGHPIVFNLNIGGALPELFEAMFMTGSFEESILKQIRTKSSE
jgi:hypothetical protein